MTRHRLAAVLAVLLATAYGAAHGQEAAPTVETRLPRAFGYFVGDTLDYRAIIVAPTGYALDGASLPQVGALDYWLDLVAMNVTDADGIVTVDLRYQTFYVPLEPSERILPPQRLRFLADESDGAPVEAALPSFTFVMSPLRPIMQRSRPEAMQPDILTSAIDTRPRQWQVAGAWAFFAVTLLALLRYRGIGPFAQRRQRPLHRAARRLSALSGRPQAYGQSLAVLHRALDATYGRRLFADDIEAFAAHSPRYDEGRADLERFFAASRLFHFSERPIEAARLLPPEELPALARRLSALERAP